jgi:hypothetical protein
MHDLSIFYYTTLGDNCGQRKWRSGGLAVCWWGRLFHRGATMVVALVEICLSERISVRDISEFVDLANHRIYLLYKWSENDRSCAWCSILFEQVNPEGTCFVADDGRAVFSLVKAL